jgi:thiamine biosynthesis lipoprotein
MRGTLRVLSLLVAAWLLAACGQPEPWRQESYVFGTRVELAIAAASEAKARAAADKVLRDFDYLHRTYHAWQPSELSALNEAIAPGAATKSLPSSRPTSARRRPSPLPATTCSTPASAA